MADDEIVVPDGSDYSRSNRFLVMRAGGGTTLQERQAQDRTPDQRWDDRRTTSRHLTAAQGEALRIRKRGQAVSPSIRRRIKPCESMRKLQLILAEPRTHLSEGAARLLNDVGRDHTDFPFKIEPFVDVNVPGPGYMLHRLIAAAENNTEILPRPTPTEAQRQRRTERCLSLAERACAKFSDSAYLLSLLFLFSRAHRLWLDADIIASYTLLPEGERLLKLVRSTSDALDILSLPAKMNDSSTMQMLRLRLRHLHDEHMASYLPNEFPYLPRLGQIIQELLEKDMGFRQFQTNEQGYDAWRTELDEEIAKHGDETLQEQDFY